MADMSSFCRGVSLRQITALLLFATALFISGCESPEERARGYVARAEQLLEEDNFVKAELEAKNALQIEPKNADARFVLAEIAEARGDFPEMASNLRSAIEARPDFLDARIKLGTIYALGGLTEEAKAELDASEKLEPNNAGVRMLRARLLAASGDLEAAAVELQAALETDPESKEALGLLANITAATDVDKAIAMVEGAIAKADDARILRLLKVQLLQRKGSLDEVEAELRSLASDYSTDVSYSYQLARYLAAAGKIDDVEEVLRDVIERQPDSTEAKLALVQFIGQTGSTEAGEALLREFMLQSPDDHELRIVLARQYQLTGQQDKAVAEYQAIVAATGNEDIALRAKGRLAAIDLAAGNLDVGEAIIEEILAVDSMNSEALLLRGALNFDRDKLKDAVSDLRSVLRREENNQRAQLLLARAHTKAEDFLLAKDAYARALQMNAENSMAVLELVRIFINEGEFNEAEGLLVEQLTVAPANIGLSRAYIAVLIKLKRFDDALDEARRVAELPEQIAVGEYLAGGIYQVRERYDDAISAFRRSLAANPLAREPLQALVATLMRSDRANEARSYLENMSSEYPDNLYAKTLLGQVLVGSGETLEAREIFESTLSENEGWLPGYTALAGLNSADVGAQIDIYKRGLEAMPASQELALLLGTAYERNGEYDAAIAAYERVLAADAGLEAVANNLAALLADHRSDEASFERALRFAEGFDKSRNPAFLDTLGWVHYRLGDYDVAQPFLEKAVDVAPGVPVLRYHLGMNYFAQGRPELAREHLQVATAEGVADFFGKEDASRIMRELGSAH